MPKYSIGMIFSNYWRLAMLVLLSGSLLLPSATVAKNISLEHQIKAALVYKFILFVDFPESSLSPSVKDITVCHIGKGPMFDALRVIEGEETKGRRLRIQHVASLRESAGCQALFVDQAINLTTRATRSWLSTTSVLTISDGPGFTEAGGMIGFAIENKKVGYAINLDAIKAANFVISSKVLRMAKIVKTAS